MNHQERMIDTYFFKLHLSLELKHLFENYGEGANFYMGFISLVASHCVKHCIHLQRRKTTARPLVCLLSPSIHHK